jgi:hypothetical protein
MNIMASRTFNTSTTDQLVLATVNAPYKRDIDAATLRACLAGVKADEWQVHLATFFTDVSTAAIFVFADAHGISKDKLAEAYRAMKARTGESNPRLEAELGQLAAAPR